MLHRLINWWRGLQWTSPPEPDTTTDEHLGVLIQEFMSAAWFLRQCTEAYWDWVEVDPYGQLRINGKVRALKVNERVAVCESDDDLDFSEYVVVLDRVAALVVLRRAGRLEVRSVSPKLWGHALPYQCSSVDEFKALPAPFQRIMREVFQLVYEIALDRQKAEAFASSRLANY